MVECRQSHPVCTQLASVGLSNRPVGDSRAIQNVTTPLDLTDQVLIVSFISEYTRFFIVPVHPRGSEMLDNQSSVHMMTRTCTFLIQLF